MNLTPGTWLPNEERRAYEVVGHAWSDARNAWWRARKPFRNFRQADRSLYEADPEEWLDVLARVPLGPETQGSGPLFEREEVLALPDVPWFLEPIDWMTVLGEPNEPALLVVADPHAERLSSDPSTDSEMIAQRVRVSIELLALLERLHEAELVIGSLEPADFLLADAGRWFFVGTDRIRRFSEPDAARHDIVHWARFVDGIIGGRAPSEPTLWASVDRLTGEAREAAVWLNERVRLALRESAAADPRWLEAWQTRADGARVRGTPISQSVRRTRKFDR